MNPAVRAAIEARITELDAQITQCVQVHNSYESQLIDLQNQVDTSGAHLDQLEAERGELLAALPEADPES